jgi:hypothetical protein
VGGDAQCENRGRPLSTVFPDEEARLSKEENEDMKCSLIYAMVIMNQILVDFLFASL